MQSESCDNPLFPSLLVPKMFSGYRSPLWRRNDGAIAGMKEGAMERGSWGGDEDGRIGQKVKQFISHDH